MKLFFAADHAGLELKSSLINAVQNDFDCVDLGPVQSDAPSGEALKVDYPDYSELLCTHMAKEERDSMGVLICGSGMGMSIAANRFRSIRAALCINKEQAKLSREHNNANVLCLGARFLSVDQAKKILNVWTQTQFEGGRHERRVEKMDRFGTPLEDLL